MNPGANKGGQRIREQYSRAAGGYSFDAAYYAVTCSAA